MSDAKLQELIDKQAITDLFNAYVDALDYKRWSDLDDMFVPEATASWFQNQWSQSSRDEIIAFVRSWVEEVGTHHILGNYTATINGDRAKGACRVRAHHAGVGDRAHLFEETLGVFSGDLVRQDSKWRFTHFTEELMVMLGTFDVFGDREG
ncbi:nuclear transport factor 2 family protein [Sphingomonas sp.]|uniref:nuclear transport factor 2 family protein n=1 Tax=Sphingomonas sp. TaxID=28214 RepID=UPI003D6C93D7